MGIPTGSPQGQNPAGGGLPAGRPQGGQQPPQQRPRQGGLPQPQQGAPRQAPSRQAPSRVPPRQGQPAQPSRQPQRAPQQMPQQRPQAAPVPQRRQEELPDVPDESFEDPFDFDGPSNDPFSDLPQGYGQGSEDELTLEDDPFTQIEGDQRFDYGDEESFDEPDYQPTSQQPQQLPQRQSSAARPARLEGVVRPPAPSRRAEEEYSEDFVDKENLKLKAFGSGKGGKSKKTAKVGDFDARKNMEGQRKIYRGVFIAAIVAIVGFGAYQTFLPQEALSTEEVESIAAAAVGETGFPTTKGEGFAISFIDSLLNLEPGQDGLASRSAALSYFYGTGGDSRPADSALTSVGNIRQQVVYGPVALDSTPLTANAASYEIAVLIKTTDVDAPVQTGVQGNEQIAASLRWVSFNVNVYYDEAKNSFAIAPNSPTLLPAPSVEPPSALPASEPLGDSVDNYPESIRATVIGFLSGYRESTKTNFDKILQYIGTDADEALRDGLGSRYEFANAGDPASSTDISVFAPNGEADLSELKIQLTVDWRVPAGDDSGVVIPSHYVLTLQSSNGVDYTVTKFAPYYWTETSEPAE